MNQIALSLSANNPVQDDIVVNTYVPRVRIQLPEFDEPQRQWARAYLDALRNGNYPPPTHTYPFLAYSPTDFDFEILSLQLNEMLREHGLIDRCRQNPDRKQITFVTKIVKRSVVEAMMPDKCGICLDAHSRGDTITTDCGHDYCKPCFNLLASIKNAEDKDIMCPNCRNICDKIIDFRMHISEK